MNREPLSRARMLNEQLAARGIRNQAVLDAMNTVDREAFVPIGKRHLAYGDFPIPIECGQTISQPFVVAFMCDEARIKPTDRILEVGTGSGYGAAVLSRLANEVHTVERFPQLAETASERLHAQGYLNAFVHLSDGTLGLADYAPYDAILVTAGAKVVPQIYREQLAEGGRIVIPIGETRRRQTMYRFTMSNGKLWRTELGQFAFVPLIGQDGW